MDHQGGVKPGLIFLTAVEFFQLQQFLEPHSLVLIQTEDTLHEGSGGRMGDSGVYDLIHFFLRVVFNFHGLVSEEAQPDLADVPHELVLSI